MICEMQDNKLLVILCNSVAAYFIIYTVVV